ncbi:hypothetical protein [Mucilaginibacter sp. FT3.2]|uniref:hypothetical protein n=1 Tax=Mucilaginibacter sp. FT3.2 TaxID=2723090 RepID=UPI003B00FE66
MLLQKIKYFLFLAVIMLTAKPFIGFSAHEHMQATTTRSIVVKAFTKRKQEYAEDSEFNMATVQQQLAEPVTTLLLLFSFLLDQFFPSVFAAVKNAANGILLAIRLSLFPAQPRYLLSGTLLI